MQILVLLKVVPPIHPIPRARAMRARSRRERLPPRAPVFSSRRRMMRRAMAALVLLAGCRLSAGAPLVLRLRLPNGVMRRVDASPDDDVRALRKRLIESNPDCGILDGARLFLDDAQTREADDAQTVEDLQLGHGAVLYAAAAPSESAAPEVAPPDEPVAAENAATEPAAPITRAPPAAAPSREAPKTAEGVDDDESFAPFPELARKVKPGSRRPTLAAERASGMRSLSDLQHERSGLFSVVKPERECAQLRMDMNAGARFIK